MQRFTLSLLCVLVLFGFSNPANAQSDPSTVVELAASNPNLSTFVAAVQAADLANALSDEGPYTVFAPTNDAFEKLPAGLVDALLLPRNKKVLVDILTFHVVEKKVNAEAVVAGVKADNSGRFIAPTMNGNLTVTNKGGVMVKGEQGRMATVTGTDMMAGNGIIHTIDNVLLPEGVDAAGLLKATARAARTRMQTEKDNAAEAVTDGIDNSKDKIDMEMNNTVDDINDRIDNVEDRLETEKNDMIDSANDRMDNAEDRMRNGNMTTNTGMQNRSSVSAGQLDNGIAQVATANGNFTTLVGALGSTGLAEMMGQNGDYTVFAPTDDAFNALPSGAVAGLSNDQLSGVLQYHVLPYRISASQLTSAISDARNYLLLQTINGKTLVASVRDGKVVIMDDSGKTATVVTADVQADNGVVHAIDGVLMPR
ncbi:fasciclin domain-containing protein [Neolewinella antarctica]|uniref:Surface protein with fasciclin (FAS1) repeats n=1 Tax=Neolewinella antarctica TaxID=442734 RepID=A0ABX0X7Z0_9BACT|nr:fasciclin domain-containing protein [Neolewinella antarctica]NJC25332.1 putative surface protein with fasciclin (FAS1) repeats [Neolewinella antarctica]